MKCFRGFKIIPQPITPSAAGRLCESGPVDECIILGYYLGTTEGSCRISREAFATKAAAEHAIRSGRFKMRRSICGNKGCGIVIEKEDRVW